MSIKLRRPHSASPTLAAILLARLSRYPPSFVAHHPLQTARNLIGNHPSKLANRYLKGLRGVEIGGAAYNDFFLKTINVDYSPRPPTTSMQLRWAGRVMPVDVVARADTLPFADRAFDFVLASHVAEHLPDPIKGIQEWARVASRHVFVILPPRTNQYDCDRPLTTLAELVDRHDRGFASFEDRHWTVWTPRSFCELCTHLGIPVAEVQDPDDKRGNGFAVVLDARTHGDLHSTAA